MTICITTTFNSSLKACFLNKIYVLQSKHTANFEGYWCTKLIKYNFWFRFSLKFVLPSHHTTPKKFEFFS